MTERQFFRHWRFEADPSGIMWAYLDRAHSTANVLDEEVLEEFEVQLDELERNEHNLKAFVILSGKPKTFILGADVHRFARIADRSEAFDLIRRGQELFNRLERLPMVTVAAIHGLCLGGGFELALACRYRIATSESETKIGLPEVKLGIHPGWGGSVRLVRWIGALKALPMMLSGSVLDAKSAYRQGMLDAMVPLRQLKSAVVEYVRTEPPLNRPSFALRWLESPQMRRLLAWFFRTQLSKKISETHYPAPYALLRQWERYGTGPSALLREAESVADLFVTATSRQLVRVFMLQEQLKKDGAQVSFHADHVHVVGAGVMGGDIAAWCALRGCRVTLQDSSLSAIHQSMQRAKKLFEKKLKDPRKVRMALDRLIPDVLGTGVPQADVIIEAIVEQVLAKQTVWADIEYRAKDTAIFATNTSSIPLPILSASFKQPERLLGIHFFNPVAQMPLVELIYHPQQRKETIDRGAAFIRQIDKLPLRVRSAPGFLVNRILMPYLMEALTLHEEGYSADEIDRAALDYGMPMGPVLLADTVGLDVCLMVAQQLVEEGITKEKIPERLHAMVADKKLGKKTGSGFYTYRAGKPVLHPRPLNPTRQKIVTERLMFRMFNEAAKVLREGVVTHPDAVDAGLIFGAGFAPFRGGVIQAMRDYGIDALRETMEDYARRYGERYQPDAYLQQAIAFTEASS